MFETTLSLAGLQHRAESRTEVGLQEWVADKGYHSSGTILAIQSVGNRSYISEPQRGRRKWRDKEDAKQAVYGNRRRIKSEL